MEKSAWKIGERPVRKNGARLINLQDAGFSFFSSLFIGQLIVHKVHRCTRFVQDRRVRFLAFSIRARGLQFISLRKRDGAARRWFLFTISCIGWLFDWSTYTVWFAAKSNTDAFRLPYRVSVDCLIGRLFHGEIRSNMRVCGTCWTYVRISSSIFFVYSSMYKELAIKKYILNRFAIEKLKKNAWQDLNTLYVCHIPQIYILVRIFPWKSRPIKQSTNRRYGTRKASLLHFAANHTGVKSTNQTINWQTIR